MVLQHYLVASLLLVTACSRGSGPTTTPEPPAHEGPKPATEDGPGEEPFEPDPAGDEAGPTEEHEQAHIDGVRLWLSPGSCVLVAQFLDQERSHRFAFPGECHFARDKDDQLRVVATEHGKALLVESSKPDGGDCDTALQVVVITERGPELSSQVQRVGACAPGVWDEMMFHVMASERTDFGLSASSS